MIEGNWLVVPAPGFAFSSPKTVETFFARNLLPGKPAKRFSKFCYKISSLLDRKFYS